MISIEIPGHGVLEITSLVTDYTGTLSVDGVLIDGVRERLRELSDSINIYVLTSDTFGMAKKQLKGIDSVLHILTGEAHDGQKEKFVFELGPENVAAFGNGRNDRLMLRAAALGIAVSGPEGSSVEALVNADVHVTRAIDGLDLLLKPLRLKAGLRT